jgi:hypothetical protein
VNLPEGLTAADVKAAISGADVTSTGQTLSDLGGGSAVTPLGPFSIRIEFGSPGKGGGDDI